MTFTIKHLYNSALGEYKYTKNDTIKLNVADYNSMNIGYGWKLNIMQSMVYDALNDRYIFTDESGKETCFKKSEKQVCCDSNSQCYNLYGDENDGDILYDPDKCTLKQGDDTYKFDFMGRLVQIEDSSGNHMDINYNALNRITSVTDGAGRDFWFAYSGDFLTSISAPDDTKILYAYNDNLLSTVTYPDGKKVIITYTSNKPAIVTLFDAAGNSVYKVAYTFIGDRLADVTEYGLDDSIGAKSSYSYSAASGRTIVETTEQADEEDPENAIKTVYTFDDEGNIVSEYVYSQDIGNIGVDGEESGIHPHSGDGGVGVVSNINNLLIGHNFEDLSYWHSMPCNCGAFTISKYESDTFSKFGGNTCWIQNRSQEDAVNGIYQVTNTLPAGEYTFSVYTKIGIPFSGSQNPGVFIRVTDTSDNILAESERLTDATSKFIRLIAPFELTSAQSIKVEIMMSGMGSVDFDGAQLENNPYANAYNMLENGNFERNIGWSLTSGASYTGDTRFNMSRSLMIIGGLEFDRYASQKVAVKKTKDIRETFTLSGWAKGYGLPNHSRDGVNIPTFRLRAEIRYTDGSTTQSPVTADFSPCTEEWQFASVQFSKDAYKRVKSLEIFCDYGYNTGTAYFDDIQLVRNSIETGLSATDFEKNTDTSESAEEETSTTKNEITDNTPTFTEVKDRFGNALTETIFTDGEFGTIYRAFGFTPDCNCAENAGNDLVSETDARGNKVLYTVNEETSRNEEIVDRCGNKTAYEYDASGKTTKVTSKDAEGNELANVSYAYDAFDNMTEIVRGDGMKYVLKYNAYHNLESIGVDGKQDGDLIKYTYKNGNGRLKEMTYANGDKMKATYNGVGQMVAEKWYNSSEELTAHYKYVYDGEGNIVRSIDIKALKEYNYQYEDGKIIRATESDILFTNDIITSKSVINAIQYHYDADDKMTKKVISSANGATQTIYYETGEDNTVVKFSAGGKTITSHSKTDSFGRKVFDELQLGKGFVSRQFSYHAGEITEEHTNNEKLKSSATTQLVSQIILSGGRTISYEYDEEERITTVFDSVDGTTEYTYDALGQLVEEKHKATEAESYTTLNTMTYDNYGNILSKNGVAYTYDTVWKDKLTGYGEQTITYDAQGNPITYLGHNLTWEKGRQLKSFDSNIYTYNENGIRTSKTVDGIEHTYTLEGTKILREEWNGNTLIPFYDNEESVCGILYNNEPYYFQKNLQGDIIGITNNSGKEVAKYTYDAWGVCTSAVTYADFTDSVDIAAVNPFRYRGYYYDEETGLYYVSSRYYDPEIGRWINADNPMFLGVSGTTLSYNLFTYCENNPVNYVDLTGYVVTPANVIGAVVGLVLGAVGGYFLSRFLADKIGLKGWRRTAFIVGISAIISAAAAVIGYFIGPYIAKAFKALLNGLRGLFKPKFGTQLGRLGTLTRNTKPVIKGLTKHGLQRMTQRGVSKALAQKIINTGYAVAQGGGKVLYFTKEGVVVLTSAGQVVTAYSSAYFDEAMQAIVSLFYK